MGTAALGSSPTPHSEVPAVAFEQTGRDREQQGRQMGNGGGECGHSPFISRPASMPLITKDAPEVAVDRGDEQCALDRCESNASRRCGCARELGLRSQSSAQVGQNWIRNRQQPFRVATRAVTLWPQRGSCVATAGSEGQRTRWGSSSGRAAVLARAAERAPRRARRPPVSKITITITITIH